jgi:hypothetical protein
MSFEEIKREALKLPPHQKWDLIYALLESLEDKGFKIDWERFEVVGRPRETHTASNETF